MEKVREVNTEIKQLCMDVLKETISAVKADKSSTIFQAQQFVYNLLYDKIKNIKQQYSETDFNKFLVIYNACLNVLEQNFSGTETEKCEFEKNIDLLRLTSLDGETIDWDDDLNVIAHVIYDDIAQIIFFYLGNTVTEKQIKIADLGCYLPDNRGLDTNYEFSNGLIAREIMSFRENQKQFHKWHTIKSFVPSCSPLETMIFNNKYHDGISYVDDKDLPENLDGVIVNVPYVSIPYQYGETNIKIRNSDFAIDFSRLKELLKTALETLSTNGTLFLVFRTLDIFPDEDMGSRHRLGQEKDHGWHPGSFFETPSYLEWSKLYSLFSKNNLKVDSIIKTCDAPNDRSPGFEFDYLDSSGVIILRNKETFNKPYYSVVNFMDVYGNSTSNLSISQLHEFIKSIIKGTKLNDFGVTAVYFNNTVEFNGYINDTKDRELFYKKQTLQLTQGFKALSGKDIIQNIHQYDVISDTGLQENENSIFIPLNRELLYIVFVTYSIDEFDKELEQNEVRYRRLKWDNIPWYCHVLQTIDNPNIPVDKKEKLNNALSKFKNYVWKRDDFFDITEFGFEIREDAIYYEDILVQDLNTEDKWGNEISSVEFLKKQILKSNVFEAVLSPKVILPAYFKMLMNTRAGDIYFRELGYKDPDITRSEVFLNTKFIIPTVPMQEKLIQHDTYLANQERQLKELKRTFYDYIGGGGYFAEDFKFIERYNYDVPDMMKSIMEAIPQPIASILYLDSCEENIARKNINYFHLFEAISHFHATVLLSMIKRQQKCKSVYDKIISDIILRDVSTKNKKLQVTFGTWTTSLKTIDRQCADNIPFDKQLNTTFNTLLSKANEARNTQMGHAPRWSEIKENELNMNLRYLAKDILTCFSKLYTGYKLILGPFIREVSDAENDTEYIHCYKAMGPNPRFTREIIEVKGHPTLFNHRLYLVEQGTWNSPVELLPFFTYMPLCEDDDKLKSLGYFHSANLIQGLKQDNRFVVWCSYDCGDYSTSAVEYKNDWVCRDLIDFLTPYWKEKIKR